MPNEVWQEGHGTCISLGRNTHYQGQAVWAQVEYGGPEEEPPFLLNGHDSSEMASFDRLWKVLPVARGRKTKS